MIGDLLGKSLQVIRDQVIISTYGAWSPALVLWQHHNLSVMYLYQESFQIKPNILT